MSVLFDQTEEVLRFVATGSQGTLRAGYAITKMTRGNGPEVVVRSDTTFILGYHPESSEKETELSCAEWAFEVSQLALSKATEAHLMVCCERVHGGLHSKYRGATAHIFVNKQEVEIIPLLVIPEGYTDYHHREFHPESSTIPPMNRCNTTYRFSVPINFIKAKQVVVRITLDPHARWDIDYVVLIISYSKRKLRPWLLAALGALGGFVAGQLGDEIWKLLFAPLISLIKAGP